MTEASEVAAFWRAAGPDRWFEQDPAFDAEVRVRFEALHLRAARGELHDWALAPEGALALLLLLDQFPRNMYRGTAHAFATDGLGLCAAERAVGDGLDVRVALDLQPFFYLPFEHQEDRAVQARAVALVEGFVARGGEASYLRYARLHAEVIDRFGRFPHRNAVLGRVSTAEESAYLDGGGFKG